MRLIATIPPVVGRGVDFEALIWITRVDSGGIQTPLAHTWERR